MLALLRKACVIDNPGHHGSVFLHRRHYLVSHLLEQLFIAPRGFGYQMMEGLPHPLHVGRIQTRSHRLDAFAFARQQQAFAVILQRRVPVLVPRGFRQAFHVCREALLLWAWRGEA
jgi:hypothetical protein